MKLLFDENLSPSLVERLHDIFSGSAHIRDVGLKGADDADIWAFAAANGFVIVTKDDDFREMSVLRGAPPKIIVVTLGNCSSAELEDELRGCFEKISLFSVDTTSATMDLP